MRYDLLVSGKEQSVEAEWINGQLWYHFEGETFVHKIESKSRQKTETLAREELHALMPGKITKVLRPKDSAVEVGDVVIVMEAMKMEYSLKSEVIGKVSEVFCKVGDQVVVGKLLAKISQQS